MPEAQQAWEERFFRWNVRINRGKAAFHTLRAPVRGRTLPRRYLFTPLFHTPALTPPGHPAMARHPYVFARCHLLDRP